MQKKWIIKKMKPLFVFVAIFGMVECVQADYPYFFSRASGDWSANSTWDMGFPPLPAGHPGHGDYDYTLIIGGVTIAITNDGQGSTDCAIGYANGDNIVNVAMGRHLQINHALDIGLLGESGMVSGTLNLAESATAFCERLRMGVGWAGSKGVINIANDATFVANSWGGDVIGEAGTGFINMHGTGSIEFRSGLGLTIGAGSCIDIESGQLKVKGDYRAELQGYVDAGKIISRGGLSSHCFPVVSYLDGYTYVKTGGCTCKTYLGADMNHDCYVDLADFAILGENWLICYDSQNAQCLPNVCAALLTKSHQAIIPAARTESQWQQRHADIISQIAIHKRIDLIFIGDSITENIKPEIWNQYYLSYNPLNLGFSGDMTQNVLWRLENGEIDGISPKLAVILIGTNNTYPPAGQVYSAQEIADGIMAICCKVRRNLPNTKILLLAIFPRGEYPSTEREKNAAASLLASQIADGRTIYYMDINNQFIDSNGKLPASTFPDFIHPNLAGDTIWAEAIKPTIQYLMGL
jgi:beta-glucosidase